MNFQEFKNKYQKGSVEHFHHATPENPLVSVLVQTYNHQSFLKQCLDAILSQQTQFDFEILLGEDASADKTRAICKEYAEKYPNKIRLFLHSPNSKIKVLNTITGNFNAFYNLFQARGNYIAFCEGDDYWADPLKLQKQVEFLKTQPEFILTYHRFKEKFESSMQFIKNLEQPEKDIDKIDLIRLKYHPLLSTICFRNYFKNIPEEMIEVINVDSFLLSLLGKYGKAKFQGEIVPTIYRRHSDGAWSGSKREVKFQRKIKTFSHLIIYYERHGDLESKDYYMKTKRNCSKMLFFYHLKNFAILKAGRLLLKLS